MVVTQSREKGDVDTSKTTNDRKTREQKRQREYYIKTKSKSKRSRRNEESDNESDDQRATNIFTTEQVEAIKDIMYEYMTTDFTFPFR